MMENEMKEFFENDKLVMEMIRLYGECDDEGVSRYFDLDSEKNLKKKIRVLKKLINGEDPDKIGKEYFEILEKLPSGSRDGATW